MIKNFTILLERTGFPAIITENGECFDIGDRCYISCYKNTRNYQLHK